MTRVTELKIPVVTETILIRDPVTRELIRGTDGKPKTRLVTRYVTRRVIKTR